MADANGTFFLTGANGGLGANVVSQFLTSPFASANKGLFAVRNSSSAATVVQILKKTEDQDAHEIIALDLGDLAAIRATAKDVNRRVASGDIPPIRVLVLNAALQQTQGQNFTTDGFEGTFATNYLANFLLVLLLLKSINREKGRIVIISSWTHDPSHPLNQGHIKDDSHRTIWRDPNVLAKSPEKDAKGDEYSAGMRRYGMSKTLLVMFVYELQRRLEGTEYSDISVLAVDPGAMPNTSLIRESSWFLRFMVHWIAGAITPLLTYLMPNGWFRTPYKSATDVLTASFDEETLGKHPKTVYLNGSARAETSPEARDESKQKQLWEASVRLTGLKHGETVLDLQ